MIVQHMFAIFSCLRLRSHSASLVAGIVAAGTLLSHTDHRRWASLHVLLHIVITPVPCQKPSLASGR